MSTKCWIYLAGPVSDQTHEAVNIWRDLYTQAITSVSPSLVGVSPVRYEDEIAFIPRTRKEAAQVAAARRAVQEVTLK